MAEGQGSSQMVRVAIPDIKAQKCIVLSLSDTVWAAKQLILDKIFHDLPKDPLNYSLYLPASGGGRLGKFLDDGYLLSHYATQGKIPRLEMRYKKRDYSLFASLSEKALIKANSKPNQKKLIEYLTSGSVKKVEKLLESGLDPNFVTEDGNTPLGVACGRHGHIQCIMPLLSGGAHIDFRGKDGLTPMHRAAIGGNAPAVNILLSYRASPNYRDAKGLTPIFHTAIMGDDAAACATLLRHRAELGCTDHGGWTELHHAAKYGHCAHIDLLIRYGADINAQNLVGNTPLHVAASHGQVRCALLLLKRGAKRDQANFAGQIASQVAILCGHHGVSGEISSFKPSQLDTVMLAPDYNPNARIFAPATFAEKKVSELCPVKPPVKELARALTEDWEDKSFDDVMNQACPEEGAYKFSIPRTDSTSTNGSASLRIHDNIQADNVSTSSAGSAHSASGSGGSNTPMMTQSAFQQQRERLYRAGAGRYVAVQDFDPQGQGDIPLRRGMPVEVLFIGKGGYWEGKAGGRDGWFPCAAIKEVTNNVPVPVPNVEPDSPPIRSQQVSAVQSKQPVQHTKSAPTDERGDEDKLKDLPTGTATAGRINVRSVIVTKGSKGYGFAMRGVRATKAMQFRPTPQVPALQYIGNVEPGGAAAEAGLCTGDFLLEVNGHNVTYSTHDEVVSIVRKSGGTLSMKVATPLVKPKSVSQQIKQQMTPVATPDSGRKSSLREEESPKPAMKSSLLGMPTDGDRETVIGANTLPRLKGSPAPPRIARSGWDSSQEDVSGSLTMSKATKAYPISQSSDNQMSDRERTDNRNPASHAKSLTLPARDYPRAGVSLKEFADSKSEGEEESNDDEEGEIEEEESSFAKALRERKNELAKRSAEKWCIRANTMPEKNSPLLIKKSVTELRPQRETEEENREASKNSPSQPEEEEVVEEEEPESALSPLQMELLNANRRRSERLEANQLRMTKGSEVKEKPSISNNPLAKALSERINSMSISTADDKFEGDDFESSPGPSPEPAPKVFDSKPKVVKPVAKKPPPTVRPKPSKKGKPDGDVRSRSESPVNVPAGGERSGESLPFKVNLKSRAEKENKRVGSDDDRHRSESPVNVPSSGVDEGRASPLPFKVNLRSRSDSWKRLEKKKVDKDEEEDDDGVTMNWKSVLKPPGTGSGRASPVVHLTSPKPAPLEFAALTPDSGQAGSESQFTFEAIPPDFTLPPPLPPEEDNRISFVDLEPPEAFFVEGSVEGTSDSGVAGDLAAFMSPTVSDISPTPPPIPGSSPPVMVPGSSASAFVFPDFGGDVSFPEIDIPEPKAVSPIGSVDLPSPLPSPTSRGSSRMDDILAPIPPPAFNDDQDLLPPPPGEDLPPPPGEDLLEVEGMDALLSVEVTSTSKTSLDSDMSDGPPPPPPPSEPPPFLDINDSVDIIDASIKSLEELDGLFQESTKAEPTNFKPLTSEPHKVEAPAKVELPTIVKSPAAVPVNVEPIKRQPLEHKAETESSQTEHLDKREPTIGSMEVAPAALEVNSSPTTPAKEDKKVPPTVAKKPPPVQDKHVKSPPPESIESRVAPEGTSKPKEGFTSEEKQSGYKSKPVAEWDVQDVCQWLRDIGLGEHASMFEENEIIGEHLLDFGKDDLKELGVKKLGHQKTFTSKLNLLL